MRVVVCPDKFAGTLSAAEAAAAIAEGWRRTAPQAEVVTLPLSDGGPGFLDALHASLGGELLAVTVTGPLGEPVPAAVLQVGETAYLESAQACGLHLVPPQQRPESAETATTRGVGELLLAALDTGARRVVVGLGGSATTDGGAGCLAALGALPGATLSALRERFAGRELVVATDVDVPLLGPRGAARGFAPQKGAGPDAVERLEERLEAWAARWEPETRPLRRVAAAAGAGAAGGLGYALLLLGGRREPGIGTVLDAVGLEAALEGASVVVTGEGMFDWQSLSGKVVSGVAAVAMRHGRPVVVLAGQVLVGRRELATLGVEAAYPVASTPEEVADSLRRPADLLADLAARVARTWTY
ncbi:MAG: glycerate kinase family protein [Actinomycetales bacterium]